MIAGIYPVHDLRSSYLHAELCPHCAGYQGALDLSRHTTWPFAHTGILMQDIYKKVIRCNPDCKPP